MASHLKFLTLNCWGIPFFTPKKRRRFQAITEILKKSDWDIVALQEVWLKSDREWIIKNAGFEFYETFDADKRIFGSGLLLLSRHKILEKNFHPFIARGFPHLLQEFDFHSTKGIGYALIDSPIGEVPVFLTHLIAKYAPRHQNDNNRLFRMAQILELVFYVRQMVTPKGFVLCGDLNIAEEDLEFETLCGLLGIPRVSLPKLRSDKKCLDYILCGATLNEINFKISQLKFEFKELINGEMVPFSDHLGVSATVKSTKASSHTESTHSILARTLRYMKHSVGMVNKVGRWIRWIPILGLIYRFFMKPQMVYIQALLTILETDLKETGSKHPLRLSDGE